MKKMLFNENNSRSLMEGFLDALWTHRKERFSPEGIEGFACFCSCLSSDPAFFGDWRTSYHKNFGKHFSDDTLLTEEEVFTAMIGFIAWHIYEWEYDVSELLNLVFTMRYKPSQSAHEWALWNEVVEFFKK